MSYFSLSLKRLCFFNAVYWKFFYSSFIVNIYRNNRPSIIFHAADIIIFENIISQRRSDYVRNFCIDLQNLRHLIGGYDTTHCKMTDYASQAEDPEVKKLFQDAADSAMKNKQELMKFL